MITVHKSNEKERRMQQLLRRKDCRRKEKDGELRKNRSYSMQMRNATVKT